MGINATVIGNLGQDPESKQVGGSTVCNFSVGTSHKRGENENTTWVRVAIWGRDAEVCQQYLSKGKKVAVSGTLYTRTYNDKSGNERVSVELDGQSFEILTPKGEDSADSRGAGSRGGYGGGTNNGGSSGGYGGRNSGPALIEDDGSVPF